MNTCKIVFTGGPCGGKTESIHMFANRLTEAGYKVNVIDETASLLFDLGYLPGSNITVFDFQNLLFKIQILKEYNSEGKVNVLLCDRGFLDGKVYITENEFIKILELNGMIEQDILSTYDGALYFKSISYEYPELFSEKRIFEISEIAIMRDQLCKKNWSEKIISCDYDNVHGFRQKQDKLYLALKKYLDCIDKKCTNNLSDYYDFDHMLYICNDIDTILKNNNISNEMKIKTRRLIK